MNTNYLFLFGIFCVCYLSGCGQKENKDTSQSQDTPISGEVHIAVDESFSPLIEAEIATFEGIYENAKIRAHYLSETDAIQQLLVDSARLAIISRPLTVDEAKYIKDRKLDIYTTKIALDAIALIVNRNNPDSLLFYTQLAEVMRGNTQTWKQLDSKSDLSTIKVVFDNSNSGIVRFMKDSLARVERLPSNCFAVDSNPKVIDYVSTNVEALGLIGVGWISDRDDSLSMSFLDKIKVVALSSRSQSDTGRIAYYYPYQSEIKLNRYPLSREIFVISRENKAGLGRGFTNFLASDPGQRIVQKAGLLPITSPTRIMQLSDDSRLKREMQQE